MYADTIYLEQRQITLLVNTEVVAKISFFFFYVHLFLSWLYHAACINWILVPQLGSYTGLLHWKHSLNHWSTREVSRFLVGDLPPCPQSLRGNTGG